MAVMVLKLHDFGVLGCYDPVKLGFSFTFTLKLQIKKIMVEGTSRMFQERLKSQTPTRGKGHKGFILLEPALIIQEVLRIEGIWVAEILGVFED